MPYSVSVEGIKAASQYINALLEARIQATMNKMEPDNNLEWETVIEWRNTALFLMVEESWRDA